MIESSAGALRFRLGAKAQIAGCLIGFAGICWLTVATAAAISQFIFPESRPFGPSSAASQPESRSGDEYLQFARAVQLLEEQAADAFSLAKHTLAENQNLRQRLAELETRPAAGDIAARSFPTYRPPASAEIAETSADMHIQHLLHALETKIAISDAMRRELNDQKAKNIELAESAEIRQEKARRMIRELVDSLSLATDGLDGLFSRLGIDAKRLIRDIESVYSGAGGPDIRLAESDDGDANGRSFPSQQDVATLTAAIKRLNTARLAYRALPLGHPVRHASRFTSGYGYRMHPIRGYSQHHDGADFAAPMGTPIHSTGDGVVVFAGRDGAFGKTVRIRHAGGLETLYAHLSKIHVRTNQRVSRNQRIAAMGSTGLSTGSHLHYEVRIGGNAVNPMQYIKAR